MSKNYFPFSFPLSIIKLQFKVMTEFREPYFLGSAFRGILGKRLKTLSCIKPFLEDCKKCDYTISCPYSLIFETELMHNKPSRYVFRPPYKTRELKPNDILELDITLLDNAVDFFDFIKNSFEGFLYLGKDRIIKLDKVFYWDNKNKNFKEVKGFIPKYDINELIDFNKISSFMRIKLYPSYIKAFNRFVKYNEMDKSIFIKAIISRLSNLANAYGEKRDKIFIDINQFDIQFNLKPSPMTRWSNRKNKKMIIPAISGTIEIKGNLEEIYPYLRAVEIVNIGKSTSFGLGMLKILSK
jgi:hypothetical protein